MAVDLDEAFRRAAKHFYDGNSFSETAKVKGKPSKYSHAMFDNYQKSLTRKNGVLSKDKINKGEAAPAPTDNTDSNGGAANGNG